MPAPDVRVPLTVLRDAVRRAVERKSVIGVAADVGMSGPGLRNFLLGGVPRQATLRKLLEWHVREAAGSHDVSPETVRSAFNLLLDGVPEANRGEAQLIVVAALHHAYRISRAPIPDWLTDAAEHSESRSAADGQGLAVEHRGGIGRAAGK